MCNLVQMSFTKSIDDKFNDLCVLLLQVLYMKVLKQGQLVQLRPNAWG